MDFGIIAVDPIEARPNKVAKIYSELSRDKQKGRLEVANIDTCRTVVNQWTNNVGCSAVLEVRTGDRISVPSLCLIYPAGTGCRKPERTHSGI